MIFKFYLGICLLVGVLAGCLLIGKSVSNIEDPVARQVNTATQEAETGDLQKAVAALKKAKSLWEDHREALASVSNHAPMDDIDTLITETLSYGAEGLREEFLAGCRQLSLLLKSIVTDHQLTWWNLL